MPITSKQKLNPKGIEIQIFLPARVTAGTSKQKLNPKGIEIRSSRFGPTVASRTSKQKLNPKGIEIHRANHHGIIATCQQTEIKPKGY